MLTMIMKPASGRAARVAKQQVGPHSALPCPGLPACPLPFASPLVPAATQIHRAPQHAAVFGPLRPSFSFSVLVSFSFSVFVPLRQDEGNFHHMRTYVLFVHSLLSLFRSRTLCLPLLCAVPLSLLRCLSCAWKFPFCKFPFACDGRRALSAPGVLIRSWIRSGFARERCSTISQRRRQTAKRSAIVDGVAGSGTACSV